MTILWGHSKSLDVEKVRVKREIESHFLNSLLQKILIIAIRKTQLYGACISSKAADTNCNLREHMKYKRWTDFIHLSIPQIFIKGLWGAPLWTLGV